jgi:hypothetical protein
MYIYIDKYDYSINNLNNEEIEEEVDAIERSLADMSENNVLYMSKLREKIINHDGGIDTHSKTVLKHRLENILNQIYVLQMRQMSESISGIKTDLKRNQYLIIFDESENMKSITLEEMQYRTFLKYRDAVNSVSVYDLFQEKIHYYL